MFRYRLQRICSLCLPFILSWSHLKILKFDQLMGQNLSNLVRMPKYGHNSAIFCPILMKLHIRPKRTKYGRGYWLYRGHQWAVGVQDPHKSLVTGPSLLVNCYLGNKFHNKIRLPPPPPLINLSKRTRCQDSG